MLKKTIVYTDYDGNECKEDFYFNLSKAEIMEMEMSSNGGLERVVQEIVKARNNAELVRIFKELILKAYGEKSLDGKRFVKSKELSDAFMQTEAYSELFVELTTQDGAAIEFFNGIIPKEARKEVQAAGLNNAS